LILIFYTGMNIQAEYITHKNRQRIKLSFILNNCYVDSQKLPFEILKNIRNIAGCYFSKNLEAWNFPYRSNAQEFLQKIFPNKNITFNSANKNSEEQLSDNQPIETTVPEKQNSEK